jgi:hypothetical protein
VRIELIEKLILALTVLSILFVGATVTLFSIMPPRSGIPDIAEESEFVTREWLDAVRRRRSGKAAPIISKFGVELVDEPASVAAGGGAASQRTQAPATNQEKKQAAKDYWAGPGQTIPPDQRVAGIPWLRKMPGVTYAKPKKVSELLYRKYQSFEDSFKLAKQGGGQFVETASGTAYQINWLDENSHLFSRVGIRKGDKVISVNGQPIGQSAAAGQAMFEAMKNERQFSVLIERKGQPLVLSYAVTK